MMTDLPCTASTSTDEDLQFLVGQDAHGNWIAVEKHGLGSGIFCSQKAAIHYAASVAQWGPPHLTLTSSQIDFAADPRDRLLASELVLHRCLGDLKGDQVKRL